MGDLKGSSSPLQITTMVPSPIFLWRFKVCFQKRQTNLSIRLCKLVSFDEVYWKTLFRLFCFFSGLYVAARLVILCKFWMWIFAHLDLSIDVLTDWMGFSYENEYWPTRFVFVRSVSLLQSSSSCGKLRFVYSLYNLRRPLSLLVIFSRFVTIRPWWFGSGESTYGCSLKEVSIMPKSLISTITTSLIERCGRYFTSIFYIQRLQTQQ